MRGVECAREGQPVVVLTIICARARPPVCPPARPPAGPHARTQIKGAKYVESSLHPPGSRSSLDVEEVVQHERVPVNEAAAQPLRCRVFVVVVVGWDGGRNAAPLASGSGQRPYRDGGGAPGVERCAGPRANAFQRRAAVAGRQRH